MDTPTARTEIVKASEMQDKIVSRLLDIREPHRRKEYEAALREYKRRLGRRSEVTLTERTGFFGDKRTFRGFQIEHMGQTLTFERPMRPMEQAWAHSHYSRYSIGGTDSAFRARDYGLLADGGKYNRTIREARVEEYAKEMVGRRWHDLFSDPIAITADGHVLNGQHRIAAACSLDWSDDPTYDPAFLVVWNVDPAEALYADGSRRTDKDEKDISLKFARAMT